jgi:hypothetical protein
MRRTDRCDPRCCSHRIVRDRSWCMKLKRRWNEVRPHKSLNRDVRKCIVCCSVMNLQQNQDVVMMLKSIYEIERRGGE